MQRLNHVVKSVEMVIVFVLLCCMLVLGSLQIISRFVIQSPIPWTEAMLTYMFVWTCFLGASLAVAEKAHFGVEIFVEKMPPHIRRPVEIGVDLIMLGFALLMVYKGLLLVENNMDQLMSAMPFTMVWPYLAMPVTGLCIFIHVLTDMINVAKARRA